MRVSSKLPDFITIGEVLSPWGIRGEVKVRVLTDFPERFSPSRTVYVEGKPLTIERASWHKGNAIVKLDSVDSVNTAKTLRGKEIEIPVSEACPLPENKFYYFQLIGLSVITTEGKTLGEITEIMTTTRNDVYVVSGEEGEILIPAVKEVIKSVDLEKREVVVEILPGLLKLNRKA